MKSYNTLKTTKLGELLLVANETELEGVYFTGHKHAVRPEKNWKRAPDHPVLKKAGKELNDYLDGKRTDFTVLLRSEGTDFQRAVWKQIARIPFGETITYTELAKRAGSAAAHRAAGTATGRNPISIIIPCHRVVAKGGTLGGYAGGLEKKKRLLEIERRER